MMLGGKHKLRRPTVRTVVVGGDLTPSAGTLGSRTDR
jgi:hypothetical protein